MLFLVARLFYLCQLKKNPLLILYNINYSYINIYKSQRRTYRGLDQILEILLYSGDCAVCTCSLQFIGRVVYAVPARLGLTSGLYSRGPLSWLGVGGSAQ